MYNVDIIWHRFTKKLGEEKKKSINFLSVFDPIKSSFVVRMLSDPPMSQKNPKMKMKIIENRSKSEDTLFKQKTWKIGLWLWLSGLSGCFQDQRSAVRLRS